MLQNARVTAFNVSELLRRNLLPLPRDIKSAFCCRFSLATCFVYQIVNFLTSHFKSSHSNWRLQRDPFFRVNIMNRFINLSYIVSLFS